MIWGGKSTNRMIKCSWIKNYLAGKEYKWNDKMFLDKKWFGGERVQMEW